MCCIAVATTNPAAALHNADVVGDRLSYLTPERVRRWLLFD